MITAPSQRFLDALKGSHERRLRITLMLRNAQGAWYEPGQAGVVSGTLSLDGSSASWRRLSADLTVPPEWTSAAESATFNGELKVEMGIGFGGVENLLTVNQASVETNLNGFAVGGAVSPTITRDAAAAVDGSFGLKRVEKASNAWESLVELRDTVTGGQMKVEGGSSYSFQATVRATSGTRQFCLGMTFADKTNQLSPVPLTYFTPTATWQTFTVTGVAPLNALYVLPQMYTTSGGPAGDTTLWDQFGLWKGSDTEWQMPGEAVDWVQIAQLRIEEWERASNKATRSFLAYDRVMRVNDFPFVTPYTPRDIAGNQLTVIGGIKDIITTAFPSTDPPVFVVDPSLNISILPPAETSFTGSRWDAVTTLAQSIAAVVFNDQFGRFIITKSAIANSPVLSITGGDGGTMVSQQYQHTRVNQHNAIGLTCEAPNGDGIFVYVVDNDPQSPTYYDGPFGRKPFMTRNDTITDVNLAIEAAKSLLALKKSGAADMDVSTVYHPLLLPRDVVSIRRIDTAAYESQVIDSIDLSLVKGTMEIKSHKWTTEPVGGGALVATVAGRSVLDGR